MHSALNCPCFLHHTRSMGIQIGNTTIIGGWWGTLTTKSKGGESREKVDRIGCLGTSN